MVAQGSRRCPRARTDVTTVPPNRSWQPPGSAAQRGRGTHRLDAKAHRAKRLTKRGSVRYGSLFMSAGRKIGWTSCAAYACDRRCQRWRGGPLPHWPCAKRSHSPIDYGRHCPKNADRPTVVRAVRKVDAVQRQQWPRREHFGWNNMGHRPYRDESVVSRSALIMSHRDCNQRACAELRGVGTGHCD